MPKCCTGKRSYCTIKRAPTNLGPRGQLEGSTTTVASDIPCGFEPLAGRELEVARQQVANAQHKVTITTDPTWSLTTKDTLVVTRPSGSVHTLGIGHIKNTDGIDREHEILCSEEV